MTATPTTDVEAFPIRQLLAVGTALVVAEILLVAGYLGLSSTTVTEARYVVYPFVWINVGLLAFLVGSPRVGNAKHRRIGLAVAGGYFVLLLAVAGNLSFLTGMEPYLTVLLTTPGWGPVVNGSLPGIEFHLVPYEVIGYAGLAYLFYANVLEISRGLLSGLLGIVTCVSCTMPFWGTALGLLGGGAVGLSGLASTYAYDVGTVVFLLTVGLLYHFQRDSGPTVSTAALR